MTGIPAGAWVLIADGEKALFTCNTTDAQNPHLAVQRVEELDNPPTREQSASAPGRRSDGPGDGRSAMEETDWHRLAKERFAVELAKLLYGQVQSGAFEKLVIVAPPRTLGELRPQLHSDVKARIVGEVSKDFTNHPLTTVEKLVSEALT